MLLWGEPVIGLALAMTNSLHGWMWHWENYTGLSSPWLGVDGGPIFYLHIIYTSAILLISYYLLIVLSSRMHRMHWRITFIPLGVILMLIGSILSVVILWNEGWKGIVILLESAAGLALARSLLDNQGMQVSQLSDAEVYERISDGLILVNASGLIIQTNPAAERILQQPGSKLVGQPYQDFLPDLALDEQAGPLAQEIVLDDNASPHYYDVSISVIHDARGRLMGWSLAMVDVTRTRLAEQAAKASEERYRALFEQASDAILLVDEEGIVVDANRMAGDLFGFSREELPGKPLADLHRSALGEDGQVAGPYCVEARRKDGTVLYIEIGSSSLSRDGRPVTMEIIRDATDQVLVGKAEEEARAINAGLRKIALEQNQGLDVPQVLGEVLDRLREILPYDSANIFMVRESMAVSVHARGYETYGHEIASRAESLVFDLENTPTLREVIERKEIVTIFDTSRSPDWKRGILVEDIRSWIGAPIIVGDAVIAIISLVSTRAGAFNPRNAQRLRIFAGQASVALENASLFDEVHRRVSELELLTSLNRDLAESRDMEALVNQVGHHLDTAFGAADILVWCEGGKEAGEAVHHLVNGEPHALEVDAPTVLVAKTVAKGRQPRFFRSQAELSEFYRSKGWKMSDLVPRACMAVPLEVGDGLTGALLVQDFRHARQFSAENFDLLKSIAAPLSVAITNAQLYTGTRRRTSELAEASDKAQRALQEAEQANQAKTRFLATMSHEIRTPLNGIIGMTSMLMENNLNNDQMAIIEIIRTTAETLSALINDILDLSKIESGRLELEHHPFNLHECMEAALNLQVPRAMERGLDLAYFIEPGTPEFIAGDIARLRQVMVNLLSNGLKFTERGGVFL
ncbi:MAG TPA: PAS domain S-box protein, partial [Anaerolinea sp.]|nr:PAS domain S-box protein [Anaerolinea sp.]